MYPLTEDERAEAGPIERFVVQYLFHQVFRIRLSNLSEKIMKSLKDSQKSFEITMDSL